MAVALQAVDGQCASVDESRQMPDKRAAAEQGVQVDLCVAVGHALLVDIGLGGGEGGAQQVDGEVDVHVAQQADERAWQVVPYQECPLKIQRAVARDSQLPVSVTSEFALIMAPFSNTRTLLAPNVVLDGNVMSVWMRIIASRSLRCCKSAELIINVFMSNFCLMSD